MVHKHVDILKVPCVWVDLILKRFIIFGKNLSGFFPCTRKFFSAKNPLYCLYGKYRRSRIVKKNVESIDLKLRRISLCFDG